MKKELLLMKDLASLVQIMSLKFFRAMGLNNNIRNNFKYLINPRP